MKIAIQANPNRGKEIISLLESLGNTKTNLNGNGKFCTYYIDDNNEIRYNDAPKDYKVYTLEEFEKEFPFKVGDLCIYYSDIIDKDIVVRILGMTIENGCIMYEVGHKDITKKHSYIYRKRETLKPYKEMNTRNVTLTLDKAKEWYKKGGELKEIALQAFTEKELTKVDLPKTWEEYTQQHFHREGYVLTHLGDIAETTITGSRGGENLCLSKKSAEAHLAMIQLEQLRNCWRQGWVQTPDDTGCRINKSLTGDYVVMSVGSCGYFLSFPTYEMAEEFLKCFRDLIEKAGDLI